MYFLDFLKGMFRKAKTGLIIYLVLNTIIVVGVLGSIPWTNSTAENFAIAFALYIGSLLIAVSPAGEWLLKQMTGCKSIEGHPQEQRIKSIFNAVYARAKLIHPALPNDIKMYIKDSDKSENAFATGRKTVCVTAGMMNRRDLEVAAALAHEFGHLAHHDTDILLFMSFGNVIVSVITIVARLFSLLIAIIVGSVTRSGGGLMNIVYRFTEMCYLLPLWIWNCITMLLIKWSNRKQEFDADSFAYKCGLGKELCYVLAPSANFPGKKSLFSFWSILSSSHPPSADRIAKLQAMGVQYP